MEPDLKYLKFMGMSMMLLAAAELTEVKMRSKEDILALSIIEQSLGNMPLCLHHQAATWAAEGILKAFKRNGVILEFGPVPEQPTRRTTDNKQGLNHG